MLQDNLPRQTPPDFLDSASHYGWISILLHWLTAIAIIALWIIGNSIPDGESETVVVSRRALHVSIAASVWLLLLFRIFWRLRSRHPQLRGQTRRTHVIAMSVHYTMLAIVLLMLISGPLLIWLADKPIVVFQLLSIESPLAASPALREIVWTFHATGALMLLWLALLHIAGALKHLMFHDDDTIARMLWPGKAVVTEQDE